MNKQKFRKIRYLNSAFFLFLLIGCASSPTITNLTPALPFSYIYDNPKLENIEYYEDPSFRNNDYVTFSVVPLAKLVKEKKEKGELENPNDIEKGLVEQNVILMKQMAFFYRNVFEKQGYKFVNKEENADIIILFSGNRVEKDVAVPPRKRIIPTWEPGKTITTEEQSNGTVSTIGDLDIWGNWSGTSTTSKHIPGHLDFETYTQPGYTETIYNIFTLFGIGDPKSGNMMAQGQAYGFSPNPDRRISSQFFILDLISKMTKGPYRSKINTLWNNLGLDIAIMTNDGNNYFPTVLKIREESKAEKVGIKPHDMIVTVDNKNMVNKTFFEVVNCFLSKKGKEISVTVWRVNEKLEFKFLF